MVSHVGTASAMSVTQAMSEVSRAVATNVGNSRKYIYFTARESHGRARLGGRSPNFISPN